MMEEQKTETQEPTKPKKKIKETPFTVWTESVEELGRQIRSTVRKTHANKDSIGFIVSFLRSKEKKIIGAKIDVVTEEEEKKKKET